MANIEKKLKISFKSIVKKSLEVTENILKPYYREVLPLNLKEMPRISENPFFFSSKNKEEYISFVKEHYSHSIKQTVEDANKICNNTFNLLGSGDKNLGKNINWRQDFKSGYSWPLDFYTKIKIDLRKNADIKVPWELSRFQFSTTLGKSYWYTNDKKYLNKWKELVLDWINKNPVEYGPNWKCAMDVSIRAVNWIIGYFFFEDRLDHDFKKEFYKILYLHGLFIKNNLEWFPVKGNHYLSDIVGLIYIGLFFNEKDWIDFGIEELKNEMKNQILEDGVDFEKSISYHRLVTELFLSATNLLLKNGIKTPDWFMKKLEKMIEFVMYYMKPNGLAPLIGDNDDGRLYIFAKNDINDHRYLLSTGACLFRNKLFKKYSNYFNEETLWLLGLNGYRIFKNIKKTKKEIASKAFKEGGFYIIRNSEDLMIIRCGSTGLNGLGSHNHNDQLSYELNINKKDILVDPGAYIYTADPTSRNLFRSTGMHNTIRIDREEQNRFYPDVMFYMEDDAKAELIKFESEDNKIIFDGKHFGYERLSDPVTHQRDIIFYKKEILIKDSLDGKENHFVELFFHLAKNVKIRKLSNEIKINNITIVIPEGFKVKIMNDYISKSYGVKERAKTIVFYNNIKLPKVIYYKIKLK